MSDHLGSARVGWRWQKFRQKFARDPRTLIARRPSARPSFQLKR